ncbi:GTP-binding protein GEM isoform X2 [Adelges cooleyi]|nr:GTP-binding protein GEM isoform X2 [Adelges cooleyi]
MMADENGRMFSASHQSKARSASICAFGFPPDSSEHLMACATMSTPPPHRHIGSSSSTAEDKRRRPAARSQSARTTANRSIRKKALVTAASVAHHHELSDSNTSVRSGYSDPRLHESSAQDTTVVNGFKRKPSTRKAPTGHRKSGAFLDVPAGITTDNKSEQEDSENSYRLRSFSFTSKGIINRGDSFIRKRRSRSNSLAQDDDSKECTPPVDYIQQNDDNITSYAVALLGTRGVGKTALISQFMTSEYINAYERQRDIGCESSVQSVCIMLNGEESELKFLNDSEISLKDDRVLKIADAYLVIYSVVDKHSFETAEIILKRLRENDSLRTRPIILVGNKVDMARSREVSPNEGRYLACTCRAKFIEVSVGINHNVDELLVGILTQIRLKRSTVAEAHEHWYKNRNFIKASLKARQMFTWVFGKEDTKLKNCENLHVL